LIHASKSKNMIANDRRERRGANPTGTDALDLRIMELLAQDGSLTHRQLAVKLGVDKRTVAKHFDDLKSKGALRITAEIDWSLIGVNAFAFVGTMTALGDEDVAKLYEYIKNEPRVIEAYSTLGSDEYFLVVLDTDLQALREEVLRKLEPLTADLSTAIVSKRIKAKNYAAFLSFLRERKGRSASALMSAGQMRPKH
jgi:DNA-binding Lrp family transcriptional regulator